jgi:hypothetical protein
VYLKRSSAEDKRKKEKKKEKEKEKGIKNPTFSPNPDNGAKMCVFEAFLSSCLLSSRDVMQFPMNGIS